MKLAVLFSTLMIAPALAEPDKPLCVDAMRPDNYNARPISRHEVLARNAISDMRGVRLMTTCIHLDRAANIGLRSFGHCIGLGDTVVVTIPGGPGQVCKVTGVATTPEDYRTAKFSAD